MHSRQTFDSLEIALTELEYAVADLLHGKAFMSEASEFSGLEVPLSKLMAANRAVQLVIAHWEADLAALRPAA